ncbi:hypothetical protein D3C84_253060 [compost metagenome]
MAVGQVAGEVVRAEHRDHTMWLVAQNGGSVCQRAALFASALTVALHGDGDFVDHAGDFGGRLPQRLAGFFTDAMGKLIGTGLEACSKGFEDGNTLIERAQSPCRKCLTCSVHGSVDLRGAGALATPDNLLADRVERLQWLALTFQPSACDVMRIHYLASRAADSGTART